MAAHRYTLLDVFTSTRLQGNPLAVVHDADGVPDPLMHAFARETRLSETSFLQAPAVAGADYRHRIWMLKGEIPFAGHPSLGAAAAVARVRGDSTATYTQQTRAGLQPVDVEAAGDVIRASMLQEPLQTGAPLDPAEVLAAVGLPPDAAQPGLPCVPVSTGLWHLLAPVRDDPGVLAAARPDYERIAALLAPFDGTCLYLAAVDAPAGRARARSFAASAEAGEDPATGSAAGPLCAFLRAPRLSVTQGVEMGRPAQLHCELEGERVRVGGDVVVVVDGTVLLDA